jgi:hypothetical protein
MIISRCRWIIYCEKIHALTVWSLKGDHDAKKIRIGFKMRRAQSRGDPAHAAVPRAWFEKSHIEQGFRQIASDLEKNPASSDLELVGHTIGKFEIRVFVQEFPLDVTDLRHILGNLFQVRGTGTKRTPLTSVLRIHTVLEIRRP